MAHLRPNSVVIFRGSKGYPFDDKDRMLFLGEIVNMRGHGIFVSRAGVIYWGYHLEDFHEDNEEEFE
jgi:hypothetical protein